jgi:Methyltransferase FkbM domain
MGIKQRLKNIPGIYNILLQVLNKVNYFTIRFRSKYPSYQPTERWRQRIALAKESTDNTRIHPVPEAGKVFRDYQLMHNGLKITLGSYYDYGNTLLLEENHGIHEPQEEYVFQEILTEMPDGACMMELGSYWAFYSMWFASKVRNARCIMVEPDPHKMNFGKLNFKLNNLKGIFDLGFIDRHTDLSPNIPVYSVDYLMKKHQIEFLDILHSDIQGYELKMLHSAQESMAANRIGCVFISTHSNDLHQQCREFLITNNFEIVSSANLDESYSWDGVLVAWNKNQVAKSTIGISIRSKN